MVGMVLCGKDFTCGKEVSRNRNKAGSSKPVTEACSPEDNDDNENDQRLTFDFEEELQLRKTLVETSQDLTLTEIFWFP